MLDMIFLGHIGTSVFLASKMAPDKFSGWQAFWATAFCAYLPDLIDKPVFWLGFAPAHTGRLWAHGILFSVVFCLACRQWIPALWPWALATPFHLVCDRIWVSPHTLFWPFLGTGFDENLPVGVAHYQLAAFLNHQVEHNLLPFAFDLTAEVAGFMMLAYVLKSAFAKPARIN